MTDQLSSTPTSHTFASPDLLWDWLEQHHADQRELWVCLLKKATGRPSVTWDDCVRAALAWGWIDGQRRARDDDSFLQRLTPRRPRSSWSARNCTLAEELIQRGTMQPPGLHQVQTARNDGRWERAYAGAATMVLPEDFLDALQRTPGAQQAFSSLGRQAQYAIYQQLQTAATVETRLRRMNKALAVLRRDVVT
ncbi:YdeI family protein [Deinococcus sp. Leaf326]|uniref:YdeI/OmpD-associated family protein n=1 Tax=Deinococcus sp. Leaf326 TaxID=1736338 RepID=UPI0006F1D019|nr:hypothetical protein ASF71_21225 [Deinococcus sp. Leaf326]